MKENNEKSRKRKRTGTVEEYKRERKKLKSSSKSNFVCSLHFMNTLPEVPFEPKFLRMPMDNKYFEYKTTSLERKYKYQPISDVDVGVNLDLIDYSVYEIPKQVPELDPLDLDLVNAVVDSKVVRRSTMSMKKDLLKKTSSVQKKKKKNKTRTIKEEISVDELIKQIESPDYLPEQIKKIEDSFDENMNLEFKHPTNTSLKPIEVLPIYPSEDLWGNQYLEFVFDSDPVIIKNKAVEEEVNNIKRENSIIKAFTAVKDNTSFLAYFTPTIIDSNEPNPNESVEYEWIREYSYRLKPDEVQYIFIQKDDKIEYCELKNKIQMNKFSKSSNEDVGKIKLLPSTGLTDYYQEQRNEELKKLGKDEKMEISDTNNSL